MRHVDVVATADDPSDDRLQGSHWNKDHIFVAIPEPSDPSAGTAIPWMSDGTGYGDEGDIVIKINVGGTVISATIVDYSTYTVDSFLLLESGDFLLLEDGTSKLILE